jgi:hypothetical protein
MRMVEVQTRIPGAKRGHNPLTEAGRHRLRGSAHHREVVKLSLCEG